MENFLKKIYILGSVNMDLSIDIPYLPEQGATIEGNDFFSNPGGKGGNQAVAAAKLGAETHLVGKLGKDHFGSELLSMLESSGVHCENVGRVSNVSSGVAVILRLNHDNRIICDYGANLEISPDEIADVLRKTAKPGDLFLSQFESPKESVFRALEVARELNMITLFNPAPAREIPDDIYPFIDYLFVNETETNFLSGKLPDTIEAAEETLTFFLNKGVKTPIITLGAKGCIYWSDGEAHLKAGYKVDAVDTTGAGDTFIGAFASELTNEQDLASCIEFATKASALAVQKVGAQQSIPNREEIEVYFK